MCASLASRLREEARNLGLGLRCFKATRSRPSKNNYEPLLNNEELPLSWHEKPFTSKDSIPKPPFSTLPMELVMLIFEIGARDDQSTAASLACLNSFWKQHLDPILYDVVIFQTYNNLRSFVKHASILNKSRVRHLGINPVLTHIGTQDIALRECTDVSSVLLRRGIGYSSIFYRDLFIGLQPCRLTVEFQLTTEVQTASALWAGVTQLHLHFTLMNSTSLVDARLAFPDLTHLWIHIDFALTFLGDNTIFSQIGEEIRLLADSGVAVRISVSPLSSQRTDRRCVGIITDYFRKQDGDPHVNIDVEFEELRMYTGPDLCEWRRNVRVEGIDFWGTL